MLINNYTIHNKPNAHHNSMNISITTTYDAGNSVPGVDHEPKYGGVNEIAILPS